MKQKSVKGKAITGMLMFLVTAIAQAGIPLWSFTPGTGSTSPKQTVSSTGTSAAHYTVTNNSSKPHSLVIQPQAGISHASSCVLGPRGSANSSCLLSLTITGTALPADGITGGPVLCQANPNGTPNPNQCYQPSLANSLNITKSTNTNHSVGGAITGLTGTVTLLNNGTNSTLISTEGNFTFSMPITDGSPYFVTIQTQPATQTCSVSNAAGTISGSNVTNVDVTCVAQNTTISVPPTGTIPVNNGTNTFTVTNTGTFAALNVHAILPGAWTAVNAVTQDASDCTAIPPLSAAPNNTCTLVFSSNLPFVAQGNGNIVITGDNISTSPTPALAFTVTTNNYLIWAVSGSTVQVIDTDDLLSSEQWGNAVTTGAQSTDDGLTNTTTINGTASIGTSAAVSCVDSQNGGFTDGWYLPAICQMGGENQDADCASGLANIDTNLVQLGFGGLSGHYWSSTEYSGNPQGFAWNEYFASGGGSFQENGSNKLTGYGVRCSRALIL